MSEAVVICLMGPTASGKTALALEICKQYSCEIISVDSALVYRGMDIGTAKPSLAERAQIPHHLIDIRDPAEPYSAADFRRDALQLIREITARGRLPLLVGGTMLYFRVLREGIAELPAADSELRSALNAEAERCGWPALHAELTRVDPIAAAKIHPNHSQRIQRALEVYRSAGVPLSQLQREAEYQQEPLRWVQLAVAPHERRILHERIAARFDMMLAQGFIDEVATLRRRSDLHAELPSIRAVGYRQAWEYLAQQTSYAEMVQKGIAATRQLAKRQLTWLRAWPDLCWFFTDAQQNIVKSEAVSTSPVMVPGITIKDAVLKYLDDISI
ncbi:MAG TPA: tRNA (adenosine(37)-N6)-dimethylallyltransferase MiaA [Spongiibacteraceae bacterium]